MEKIRKFLQKQGLSKEDILSTLAARLSAPAKQEYKPWSLDDAEVDVLPEDYDPRDFSFAESPIE